MGNLKLKDIGFYVLLIIVDIFIISYFLDRISQPSTIQNILGVVNLVLLVFVNIILIKRWSKK